MMPLLLIFILSVLTHVYQVEAGQCWTEINSSGKCNSMVSPSMTREECCRAGSGVSGGESGISGGESGIPGRESGILGRESGISGGMMSAFVDRDLSSGDIFRMKMFKGGIPCEPCKATCSNVKCELGKVCQEIGSKQIPTCVCDTSCSKKKRKLGQVCGSDGKTYKNMCRIMRKKCQKNVPQLQITHFGQCQGMKLRGGDACEKMDCRYPRTCLLDQKLRPHCVKCSIKCRSVQELFPVCGSDGHMYKSNCHLRQAACSSGRTISIQPQSSCNQTLSTFVLLDEE